ncbi:MAG TPA: oligosaccharide flippase family protein [Candidatus Acidoferrales bacterium]|nr:oligosaccharide flippase family protein [Candidatus Acidoferrales bacterium]
MDQAVTKGEPAYGESEQISLTQNAGLVGISKLISIFGSLVASIALARILSRSEYGNYEQVWLVYNSSLPLIAYGLSSSVYFFSARENRRTVYSAVVLAASIIGILVGIVLMLIAPSISRLFNSSQLTDYIRMFAVYSVISSSSIMFESVFVTEKKVGLLLLGNTITSVLFAIMVSLSAFEFHSLTVVFISVIIVGGCKSFYLLIFLMRTRNLTVHRVFPVMKAQLYYALPIFVSTMMGIISKQIDKYLVTLFYSSDQFAVYAVGSKEIPLIAVITGSASAVLFPVLSNFGFLEMRHKFVEVWKNSISKTGFFLLPMMVFLLFSAGDFMYFLFGQKYVASATIFRIFLLLIPLRLAFYGQALFSLGKQKLYMYTAIGEMILSGAASYFLLAKYGLEGAAVGKIIITYLQVIIIVGALLIFLKTNIREFFPWIKILKILILSMIASAPAFYVGNYFSNVYVRFMIESSLFASAYAAAAIATKSVRLVDLRRLRFTVN